MSSLIPSAYDALQSTQSQRLAELLRVSPLSALELFHPAIATRLQRLWGSPQLVGYIQQIMLEGHVPGVTLSGAELAELSLLAAVHTQATLSRF